MAQFVLQVLKPCRLGKSGGEVTGLHVQENDSDCTRVA